MIGVVTQVIKFTFSSYRMKTSSSFFATRTHIKSREIHRDRTMQLIKPQQFNSSSPQAQTESLNIFRDINDLPQKEEINLAEFRPIGGMNLIRKVQQSTRERHEYRKPSKKSSKDKSMRTILSSNGSRFRRQRPASDELQEYSPLKVIDENKKEDSQPVVLVDQFFKSHESYVPPCPSPSKFRKSNACSQTKPTLKSQNCSRPITSQKRRHDDWWSSQSKEYYDKSAILNQINFSKPLVETYGDRYFEFILRNRFQDDFKPHPYVYLLSNNKFSQNKAISTLKHYHPQLKRREMMVLRGKKVHIETEE